MESLPSIRLQPKHIALLRDMLTQHQTRTREQGNTEESRATARLISNTLPRNLPYDLSLYPYEWAIVSRALRPNGSNPEPGSTEAAAYALYLKLSRAGFSRAVRFDDQGEHRPPVRFGK